LVKELPSLAAKLFEAFSPGPLTILLPKSEAVSDLVTNGSPLVAIRIPNHPITLSLLKILGKPLAAPSANPFGGISPTTALHVKAGLGDRIPYILDGGPSGVGVESTIVQIEGNHQIRILRQGGVPEEELLLFGVLLQPIDSEKTVVPGSMLSHYAPKKPLFISRGESGDNPPPNAGLLRLSSIKTGHPEELQFILSPTGNLKEAAKNLFSALHFLDQLPVDAIYADSIPSNGLGKAINDRLFRASVKAR
jgi:L-threonylcarbamoyladenylate synthase